ncbi:MAG: radical SAM protein [Candidatus Aureabacteria bacterium]|nr:radical SAM protein [Candidatus Auribacterota bacterium]
MTNKCNLKCEYCVVPQKQDSEINIEIINNFIFFLQKRGLIHLGISGGEPLMKIQESTAILRHAKTLGLLTSLNTNGIQLKNCLWITELLDEIVLSLDGPEKIHDQFRGETSFQNTLDAIRLVHNIKIKKMTITVLTKENISHIPFILDIGKQYKMTCFFQPLCIVHDSINDNEKMQIFKPATAELKQAESILISAKKKNPLLVGNSFTFLKNLSVVDDIPFNCLAGKFYVYLYPDGSLYPCYSFRDSFSPKNIDKDGFKAALEHCQHHQCFHPCKITPFREMDYLGKMHLESIFNASRQFYSKP